MFVKGVLGKKGKSMTEWVSVNTCKIIRIGYNSEINTMYIDFVGSAFDTPYQKVPEETFIAFSQATRVDDFYEEKIKEVYPPTEISTENNIDCQL